MKISSDKTSHAVTRRRFLGSAFSLGAASVLGMPGTAAADAPPETKRIRLVLTEDICMAPQFLSAEMLRLEGFAQVEYVRLNYEEHPSTGRRRGSRQGRHHSRRGDQPCLPHR
jgi:hypothetical protein